VMNANVSGRLRLRFRFGGNAPGCPSPHRQQRDQRQNRANCATLWHVHSIRRFIEADSEAGRRSPLEYMPVPLNRQRSRSGLPTISTPLLESQRPPEFRRERYRETFPSYPNLRKSSGITANSLKLYQSLLTDPTGVTDTTVTC